MLEARVIQTHGINDLVLVSADGLPVKTLAEIYELPECEWMADLFNKYHPCVRCGQPCDKADPLCPECVEEMRQDHIDHVYEVPL